MLSNDELRELIHRFPYEERAAGADQLQTILHELLGRIQQLEKESEIE